MELKIALSIPDQIGLLRQRGMTIDNEDQAFSFLQANHYYHLNIYFHKLMTSPNHFENSIRFSKIIAAYENDRWLRNKLLSILEIIEINARTHLSYYLALTYGSDAFYQESIFKNHQKYIQIYEDFSNQISRNIKDPIVIHHQKKYGGKFPIRVIVEFISFNSLSKLYKNLLEKDKKEIASNINKVNDYLFGQWLHVLSIQRNICAHYGYLFRRDYPIRPIMAKSFGWDSTQNNTLFAQLLVMRRLLDGKTWWNFIQNISEKERTGDCFCLRDYGFPTNWKLFLL